MAESPSDCCCELGFVEYLREPTDDDEECCLPNLIELSLHGDTRWTNRCFPSTSRISLAPDERLLGESIVTSNSERQCPPIFGCSYASYPLAFFVDQARE